MTSPKTRRCAWAESDALRAYHDDEWGVPIYDDVGLFELLTLEGAQAGLSWQTVLLRRPGYRRAFAQFDPRAVARFSARKVETLVTDESIIRHRGKIESTIANAKAIRRLEADGEVFSTLIWSFVDGKPRQHNWSKVPNLQSTSPESAAMSAELKRRGFRFVGPTTCYSLMQAAGLVNDHHRSCFRFKELATIG